MNTDFDVWVYSAADINQSFQRIRKVENFRLFFFLLFPLINCSGEKMMRDQPLPLWNRSQWGQVLSEGALLCTVAQFLCYFFFHPIVGQYKKEIKVKEKYYKKNRKQYR